MHFYFVLAKAVALMMCGVVPGKFQEKLLVFRKGQEMKRC
jgi:hypothetical protein